MSIFWEAQKQLSRMNGVAGFWKTIWIIESYWVSLTQSYAVDNNPIVPDRMDGISKP